MTNSRIPRLAINYSYSATEQLGAISLALKPWQNHSGSFRGTTEFDGWGISKIETNHTNLDSIDYWIYSYETPIAWHFKEADVWRFDTSYYSRVTKKHQGRLYIIPYLIKLRAP